MALILFLVFSLCITCCKVDARSKIELDDQQNHFTLSNRVTHQVDNDFDCVDIYKQPALQHPLLKNHKIQLYPTFAKNIVQNRSSYGEVVDACPVEKIPIYNRTRRHQIITNSSSNLDIEDFRQYSKSNLGFHTVGFDTTQNMIFHGAYGMICGYNLSLQSHQFSISIISIESGPLNELNLITFGSGVHPRLYGDSQLRLTTYWRVDDGNKKSGCYNYDCPGFVQVTRDKDSALGSVLHPVNSIGSANAFAVFKIKQDRSTGHWWLIIEKSSIYVGYWPNELFSHLRKGASLIRFSGQTYSPPNMDSPPMGSGRLPKEGIKYSGFMARLGIIDSEYNENDIKPEYMKAIDDANPVCYDLGYIGDQGYPYKQGFLYGGPGGHNCDR